uniref:Reverse transcriptase n=1 Tax=Cannabis sativa TaxID=3483 RepID=A0A803P1C6_CANSA
MRRGIKSVLRIGSLEGNIKYLGLPLFCSRQKDADFNFIIENLTSKLLGWKAKMLSKAGHATLIKSGGTILAIKAQKSNSILKKGACKLVVDGKDTNVWGDPLITHKKEFILDLLSLTGEVASALWNKLWNSRILKGQDLLWCILAKALPASARSAKISY